ncbi:hypothetical protein EOD39_4496, partial [Acipenser ruthenus]
LAAVLEGKALQVLLDLDSASQCDFSALSAALGHRFRKVEPAASLHHHLATRKRVAEEKLEVLAADVLFLTSRGNPECPSAIQEDLAMEVFACGLTPNQLCQQVWLATQTSLEQALNHAESVEAVLEESEKSQTT